MDAIQIADLITAGTRGPTGGEDVAIHTGVILSWDPVSGANTVLVNNSAIDNLKSVQPGLAARYSAGDTVVVIRKQTQYFILGKVAAPGGAAGSAPVGNTLSTVNVPSTGGVFTDIPGSVGPSVTTYIGSNRAALVLFGFRYNGFQSIVEMSFEISGATVLPAASYTGETCSAGFTSTVAPNITMVNTCSASYLAGASVLLASGLTTFTAKYKCTLGTPTPTQATITDRTLTVIPL